MFTRKMTLIVVGVALGLAPVFTRAESAAMIAQADRAALEAKIKSLEAMVASLSADNARLQHELAARDQKVVVVPPQTRVIPFANPWTGPKSDWKEQQFNGHTYYLIPLEADQKSAAIVTSK